MANNIIEGVNETIAAIQAYAAQSHYPDLTDIEQGIDALAQTVTAVDAGPHIDALAQTVTAVDAGPHIDALAQAVNAVAAAIDRLAAIQETEQIIPLPDPGDPPTPGEPPDPLTDPPPVSHADWDSYLCGGGVLLAESIANTADRIIAVWGTPLWGVLAVVGIIAGILGGAFTGGFSLVVAFGLVLELFAALGATGESIIDATLGNISDQMRNNGTLRSCISVAMRDGDGVADKVSRVKGAIDEQFQGLGLDIAKLMVFPEAVELLAYGRDDGNGNIEYAATPVGVVCSCYNVYDFQPLSVDESFAPNSFWQKYDTPGFSSSRFINNGVTDTDNYTVSPWFMNADGIKCRYGGMESAVFEVETIKRLWLTTYRAATGYELEMIVMDDSGNTLRRQEWATGTPNWWNVYNSYDLHPGQRYKVRITCNDPTTWVVKDVRLESV